MKIISVIGDQLWASGSKTIPPQEDDPHLITPVPVEETGPVEEVEETGKVGESEETVGNGEELVNEIPSESVEVTEEITEINEEIPTVEQIRKEQDDILGRGRIL